jgi:hypothetical protein
MMKRDITDFYKGRSMCKGCVSFKRYITKYMDSYTKKGMELSFNRLLNECHDDIALVISTQPSPSPTQSSPSPIKLKVDRFTDPIEDRSPKVDRFTDPIEDRSPKQTKIDMIMTVNDITRLADDDIRNIRTYYNTLNTEIDRNDFIDKNIKPEDREYFTKYIVNKYFKPYLNV